MSTSGTPRSACFVRFQPITFMPMPWPMRATSRPMPPSPMTPSVLPRSCTPSSGSQRPPRMRRSHDRDVAGAGEHQRDGVLGDSGVAIAAEGVHGDAEFGERGDIHVARGPGAAEHDVLERAALLHHLGRHVGMVVDADAVAIEQARQVGRAERRVVDVDLRIVGAVDPPKHQLELRIAVDEQGLHGSPGRGVRRFSVLSPRNFRLAV